MVDSVILLLIDGDDASHLLLKKVCPLDYYFLPSLFLLSSNFLTDHRFMGRLAELKLIIKAKNAVKPIRGILAKTDLLFQKH